MGYWFFMLAIDLLIPAAMIACGAVFRRHAPKKINALVGYRTAMSMKNMDTWRFAHEHCGRVWLRVGLWMLPLSVLPLLFAWGKGEDAVGLVGSVVCLAQLVPLIGAIFPTEWALRREFDENGNRREKRE